ncbi:hypothetical protein PoB_006714600 [Plakobranchus ocellatus]|uniref:Shootin-1 n=1 Tax=Plakobranchus ocellatus TaxID=259542 RepID=A0AAV4D9B2_9GAST|nr:hypothetical protein PoB_006714600 [Plakobranchus ocellatus]
MSDRSIQRKEDYLDWMHDKFCASSKACVLAVKTALRAHTRENAAEIFERAIDVLSEEFPDLACIDGQTKEEGVDGNELNLLKDRIAQVERQLQEVQNERLTLESELKSVRQEAQSERSTLKSEFESIRQEGQTKCSTLESELESVKQEAQNNRSFLESSVKKNVRPLNTKLETLATETKDRIKEAAAAAAAVTPPPTPPSASALPRPLKNVRQRNSFTAQVSRDRSRPVIWDVQLLPGERLMLADRINRCVKLFNTQVGSL